MQITKIFTFEAAHQLPNKEIYGKCSRLHGHTYKLEVTIEGMIKDDGMVMNFSELKKIVNTEMVDKCDHHHLNDVFDFVTTAENLVGFFARILMAKIPSGVTLKRIRLYETPTCYATYENQ